MQVAACAAGAAGATEHGLICQPMFPPAASCHPTHSHRPCTHPAHRRLSLTAERWEDDSQAVYLRMAVAGGQDAGAAAQGRQGLQQGGRRGSGGCGMPGTSSKAGTHTFLRCALLEAPCTSTNLCDSAPSELLAGSRGTCSQHLHPSRNRCSAAAMPQSQSCWPATWSACAWCAQTAGRPPAPSCPAASGCESCRRVSAWLPALQHRANNRLSSCGSCRCLHGGGERLLACTGK